MTDSPTGYAGSGFYMWSPQSVAERYFVAPPPAWRQFPNDWIAFYETPESDDYLMAYKRKFADPFLTTIEERGEWR